MKKKLSIFAALTAAATLSASSAIAQEMEKCKVVDANGKGLIKAHKSDCAGSGHSCAGQNVAGDAAAWIIVPKGECDKINAGDFSGVGDDIKDKIEMPTARAMEEALTMEEVPAMEAVEARAAEVEKEADSADTHSHQHTHDHSHSH